MREKIKNKNKLGGSKSGPDTEIKGKDKESREGEGEGSPPLKPSRRRRKLTYCIDIANGR
jgi:hypothetical protein